MLAGEWYEIALLRSVVGAVHVFRTNIAVHLFTRKPTWSGHRFYNNTFFWESRMKRSKIHEYKKVELALVSCKKIKCSG